MCGVPAPLSVSLMHPYERGLEDLEDEEDDVDDPLGTVEVLLDRSLQIRSVKNATLLLTADCTSGSGGAAVADDALSQNSSKVGEGKFFLNKKFICSQIFRV